MNERVGNFLQGDTSHQPQQWGVDISQRLLDLFVVEVGNDATPNQSLILSMRARKSSSMKIPIPIVTPVNIPLRLLLPAGQGFIGIEQ